MNDSNENNVRQAVLDYIERGWAVCAVERGDKAIKVNGWCVRSASPEDFHDGSNVGIQTGWISGYLVCVDLDSPDAVAQADVFLPATDLIEGRPGKPRSHRYYRISDAETLPACVTKPANAEKSTAAALAAGRPLGPATVQFKLPGVGKDKTIVEIKARGAQAVAPPSLHHSGEARAWDSFGEPARLTWAELLTAVEALATACGWQRKPVKAAKPAKQPRVKAVKTETPEPQQRLDGPRFGPTVTAHLDRTELMFRASRYIKTLPASNSGERGHDRLYAAAARLVLDFDLSRDEAIVLLAAYNKRSNEPWGEDDMLRKLDQVATLDQSDDGPRGHLALRQPDGKSSDPRPVNHPGRLADGFVAESGTAWRYWHGGFYRYDGTHYTPVSEGEVKNLVWASTDREFQRSQRSQEDAARGRWELDSALRIRLGGSVAEEGPEIPPQLPVTIPLRNNVVEALKASVGLPDAIEMDTWLDGSRPTGDYVAFRNVIIDLGGDEVVEVPHSPEWFSTTCLPADYDPAATCPAWDAAVARVLPNADDQRSFRQWAGYALTRCNVAQRFLVLSGEAATGKSTLTNGVCAMLGEDNHTASDLETLFARFGIADTIGKRLVVCADVHDAGKISLQKLKQFTGSDPMPCERKGVDIYMARPTAKLMVTTNTLPRLPDPSNGVWRRLLKIDCNTVITDRVAGMSEPSYWADRGELAGMVLWALAGLRDLRGLGWQFTESDAARRSKDEHRDLSDPTRVFIADHVREAPGEATDSATVYQAYRNWCVGNGTLPVTARMLSMRIRSALGRDKVESVTCSRDGKNVRRLAGVKLA